MCGDSVAGVTSRGGRLGGQGVASPPMASTERPQSPWRQPLRGRQVVLLLVVVAAVAGIAALVAKSRGSTSSASDASSLACTHFRNVMSDVRSGILTDAELRAKLVEVHDDSLIAAEPVRLAATAMLADITQDETVALRRDVNRMDQACSEAGF